MRFPLGFRLLPNLVGAIANNPIEHQATVILGRFFAFISKNSQLSGQFQRFQDMFVTLSHNVAQANIA